MPLNPKEYEQFKAAILAAHSPYSINDKQLMLKCNVLALIEHWTKGVNWITPEEKKE